MAKNLVSDLILAHLAQIRTNNIFFKNLALSISIHHTSYHHVQYQKKTNNPILKKFSDGRTDGQTDEHTDGRKYFIGRCLTNVECSSVLREYNF